MDCFLLVQRGQAIQETKSLTEEEDEEEEEEEEKEEEECTEEAPEKPERNITRESVVPKDIEELNQDELEVSLLFNPHFWDLRLTASVMQTYYASI